MSTVSPSQAFLPTLAVLEAVKALLAAMTLPEPYTGMGNAFQDVRIYAHKNLGQALSDLLVVHDRVALIIPVEFVHNNKVEGRNLTSRRSLEIVVLVADRVIGGTANEAAVGGQDNPGMILLTELLINALSGQDLGLPAAVVEPGRGQPMMIGDPKDETFAREAWAQTFTIPAGEMRVDRGRARSLGPLPSPVVQNSGN